MEGFSSAGDGTPLSLRDTSPTGETPSPIFTTTYCFV